MRSELFREVITKEKKQDSLGEIFLAQPFSFYLITFVVGIIFIFVLLFLWLTPYQSSQILSGKLVEKNNVLYAELEIPLRLLHQLPVGKTVQVSFIDYPKKEFGYQQVIVNNAGKLMPPSKKGPIYKVSASIEQSFLIAYDKKLPLQSGMLIETSIVNTKQSMLSWLLNR